MIPAEMRESLGIGPGTRIAVSLQGTQLILEPVSGKLVDQTRGILSAGPSLSALLKKERGKDKW